MKLNLHWLSNERHQHRLQVRGGLRIQAKLGGYAMCPGVRMANLTSRSRAPADSLRRLLAAQSRPPRPSVSNYIDLTSDGESTVRQATGRSSSGEASGVGRPNPTVKQEEGVMASRDVQVESTDEVSPSASRYRIPLQTGESGHLMSFLREHQPYNGLSDSGVSLCLQSSLPRSSPQRSPWSLQREPIGEVLVELLESRPPQQFQSTNSSPYPGRLRKVFYTPSGLQTFKMMTNFPPIRPPGVVDPDAHPLSMANLRANWCSDGHRKSYVLPT